MSLADLMRKGSLRALATVTVATDEHKAAPTVAEVASVAVASPLDAVTEVNSSSLDRWCWPQSASMAGAEIDQMVSRVEQFVARGLNLIDAVALADRLVIRDRDGDDRRSCFECSNHTGHGCLVWKAAGIGASSVGHDFATMLQRCPAYSN